MVRFSITSDRYIPIGHGRSIPYFEALYGRILDVDIDDTASAIEWDSNEGHPVLVGDSQPKYTMTFNRAPNVVYDEILLLQKYGDEFPAVGAREFVAIVEGSVFELFDDGVEKPVEAGKFLPI